MAEAFDAYYKWLGIPPQEQPPHHYRLLGLQLFEADPDVIANAADRQMSHVRTYQTGRNGAQSQQILNEISVAKLCLLKPEKKAPYDQALRAKLAATQAAEAPAAGRDDRVQLDFEPQAHTSAVRRDRHKPAIPKSRQINPLLLLGGAVAALLVVVVLALAIPRGGDQAPSEIPVAESDKLIVQPEKPRPSPPVESPPKPPVVPPPVRGNSPVAASQDPGSAPVSPPPRAGGAAINPPVASNNSNTPTPTGKHAVQLAGDEFIEIMDTAALFNRGDEFTAEAWMSIVPGNRPIGVMSNQEMDGQRAISGWTFVLHRGTTPDRLSAQLTIIQPQSSSGGLSVTANRWSHFCVHRHGNRLKASIDGRSAMSGTCGPVTNPIDIGNLRIGHAKNGGSFNCGGGQHIAAFRLSLGDRYGKPFTPPAQFEVDDQTLALLDFNQGTGTELADLSGHGRIGKLSGGVWEAFPTSFPTAPPPAAIVNNHPPAQPPVVEPTPPVVPQTIASEKPKAPDEAKVTAAREQVKDLFKAEIAAAKTMDDKVKLAQTLLSQADKSRDDATSQYALCLESLRLATEGGNWAQAVQVIDSLNKSFDVDALSMKTDTLLAVGKLARGPQGKQAMVTVGMAVLDDVVEAQRSDLANKLVPPLQAASVESRDVELRKKMLARATEIKKLQQDWVAVDAAVETLKTRPDDPAANLLVGKNLCLYQGRWDEGLPLLAKSNEPIGNAAQQDLKKPTEPQARIRIGDLWWDLAESESGPAKAALGKRAGHWYQLGMPGAVGLERARLEKRLQEAGMPYQAPAAALPVPPVAANNLPAAPPAGPPPAAAMLRNLNIELGNGQKMVLRLVPPGAVMSGSQILAKVDKPFYLGVTEVTQGQWSRVMKDNPSQSKGNDELPVDSVTYDNCLAFVDKLTRGSNGQLSFRLPTAAEWQFAARAGSTGQFCFGDDQNLLGEYAYYDGNATSTSAVKQLKPNEFGFYDVHGNVWERVADLQPDGRSLALGGSCKSTAISCSFRGRHTTTRDNASREIGFRVACEMLVVPPPKQP